MGTDDAEKFLLSINNYSREKSAGCFYSKGMKTGYARHFDNLLKKNIYNAKAVFHDKGDHNLAGLKWIESVIGKSINPITNFNIFCLLNNINCIFCSRFNILVFGENKMKNKKSHNNTSDVFKNNYLNSS